MPTPHNNASKGDFAKTVLMPGDPLRAKFIAETFLTEPKLVNNVRGVQGYTGTYKGVPVSVMASGMGMPSIGIYSYELYTQYDGENIIRVGSAGAMRADMELGSVMAGQGACTNSNFADQYELGGSYAPICDFDLLMAAVESAKELGVKMPVGNLYSSDTFYDAAGRNMRFAKMGVMAVEMEAAALYCTAAYTGKRALAICSISDNLVNGTELSADERQTTLIGQKTTTCVDGRTIEQAGMPMRMCELISCQDRAVYVERVSLDSPANVRKAKSAIRRAFKVQDLKLGFAFVEFLSICPTNWGLTAPKAMEWLRENMMPYYPVKQFKCPEEVKEVKVNGY